jgi:hypothetical protein
MIAPSLGLKRTAASCEVADQYFERECGLLRLRGHDCASSSLPPGWAVEIAKLRPANTQSTRNNGLSAAFPASDVQDSVCPRSWPAPFREDRSGRADQLWRKSCSSLTGRYSPFHQSLAVFIVSKILRTEFDHFDRSRGGNRVGAGKRSTHRLSCDRCGASRRAPRSAKYLG